MTDQKTDIQIMEDVLARFQDPVHWIKGEMQEMLEVDGVEKLATCLLGGIEYAVNPESIEDGYETPSDIDGTYRPLHHVIQQIILEQYPERATAAGPGFEISDFNDDTRTTIEDVRAVCEKTIARLQEEG